MVLKNRLFLSVSILLISSGLFAFGPVQALEKPIFIEGFEEYNTTYQLNKAFSVWNDGANLKVFLETDTVNDGGYSIRVDVLGPNPYDGQKSGSIYHSLPFLSRNWTNAAGIAFWVKNPSADPLWLTFNFKEAYNEYWSVTPGCVLHGSG